jgi:Fe-S-cluster containining protein
VKEIKVKVWRHIRCSAINDSKTYEDKTMLICQVYPGVKHNLKETKILEVDLNIFGDLERKIKKIQKKKKKEYLPEEIALQRQMVPTTQTSLI